jgi:NADPH:quinone reductase-like Zn-dependent oxidoreductase
VRCIQITRFGGPEVLEQVELPDPEPAPGMHVVEVTAAGVNYADTHQTEDSYLAPQTLPPGWTPTAGGWSACWPAAGTRRRRSPPAR